MSDDEPRPWSRQRAGILYEEIMRARETYDDPLAVIEEALREESSADVERLVAQAHATSRLLELANVGPCPLDEGVRRLLNRAEAAESQLAALREEGARLREALEPLVANLHEVAIDPERPSWHAELAAAEAAILAVPERLE